MAAIVRPEVGYIDSPGVKRDPATSPYKINFQDPKLNAGSDSDLDAAYSNSYDSLNPLAPKVDPRYKQLQDTQRATAKNFRDNIPNYENDLYGAAAGNSKRQLASSLQGIKQNANQRGLLFGGARAGAEGSARGSAAADLASQRQNINQNVEQTADSLDSGVVGTGFGMAGLDTNQANYNLNNAAFNQQIALGNMQATQAALGGVGQGLGNAVGSYIGYKKPNTTTGS